MAGEVAACDVFSGNKVSKPQCTRMGRVNKLLSFFRMNSRRVNQGLIPTVVDYVSRKVPNGLLKNSRSHLKLLFSRKHIVSEQ